MEIGGRDVELVGHRRRLTKERQPYRAVATVHKGGPEPTDGVRLDMRCVRGAGHRDGLSSDLDGPLVEVLEHERAGQARHDAADAAVAGWSRQDAAACSSAAIDKVRSPVIHSARA